MGKGAFPSSDTTFLFHPFSVWLHFGPVALNLKVRSTKAWRDLNWTWLLIWSTSLWERWWRHPPGTRTSSMLKPTRFYIRMLWSCQAGRKIRWDRVSKMMFDIKLLHTAETDLVCWCPWYRSIGFPCFWHISPISFRGDKSFKGSTFQQPGAPTMVTTPSSRFILH